MLETIYALLAGAKNERVAIEQPGVISPFTRKIAEHQHIILPQMLCYGVQERTDCRNVAQAR
jgi:hypothetical protein